MRLSEAARSPGVIKKRSDFVAARNGARFHGRAFVLQGRDRPADGAGTRFGITATKKLGNAVVRNRIKRRLRAAIADVTRGDTVAELADRDIVIIARHHVLKAPFTALVEELRKGLVSLVAKKRVNGQ